MAMAMKRARSLERLKILAYLTKNPVFGSRRKLGYLLESGVPKDGFAVPFLIL